MRLAMMADPKNTQDECFKQNTDDRWLSQHTFEKVNSLLYINCSQIESIFSENVLHHRLMSNHACLDEEQIRTTIRSTLRTKDMAKPEPWGITCKLVGEPTANGRAFVTLFRLRSFEEWSFTHEALFKSTIDLYKKQNIQVHITFDRLYSTPSVISLFRRENVLFTCALKVNSPNYPIAYLKKLVKVPGSWSTFYDPNHDECLSVQFKKAYKFCLSNYFKPVRNKTAEQSEIGAWYKTSFNYVDIFDKLFNSKPWYYHQKSVSMVQLNAIIGICLVNAWTTWQNVNKCEEDFNSFIRHCAAHMLNKGNHSLEHRKFL